MSTKKSDSNEKKSVPENFSPVSERKTKSSQPSTEEQAKVLKEALSDDISNNGGGIDSLLTKNRKDAFDSDNAIQQEDIVDTMDSLQTETAKPSNSKEPPVTMVVPKRTSSKQRKESLEEYRQAFLTIPKLEDRKPVFISCEVRDRLDEIARKLGGRRMSVSGFIENLVRHHLSMYTEDIEIWRKL